MKVAVSRLRRVAGEGASTGRCRAGLVARFYITLLFSKDSSAGLFMTRPWNRAMILRLITFSRRRGTCCTLSCTFRKSLLRANNCRAKGKAEHQ